MTDIVIRPVSANDLAAWIDLRSVMWPTYDRPTLEREAQTILASDDQLALVAQAQSDVLVGFAEISLHPYALECVSSPVAYLEGWLVLESHRRQGIGARLVAAGEQWAREKGCTEFASDTWIDNECSDRAHKKLGFHDVGRLIHYVKKL